MASKTFKLLSLSILFLMIFVGAVSATTETFENADPEISGSYSDGIFVGEEDITWNYLESHDEDDYEIDGKGLILRGFSDGNYESKIYSDTLTGGISDFSVKFRKALTEDGTRQIELFIDDDHIYTSQELDDPDDDGTILTFSVSDINIEGDFVIEIRNINDKQVTIDDITWTAYSGEETSLTPEDIEACSSIGSGGDLSVDIEDITVMKGFGDDEEWLPFDEVQVEIVVENENDDDDIEDIELSWGLYNRETGEWYIDDDEDDFDLNDGEEKSITLNFRLDDDIDELEDGDFVFYVWANGELDDDDDTPLCASDSKDIDVIIEKDFVILDDIEIPDSVSCGDELHITADVWNIGDSDQDDVYVIIYNKELGINEHVEIGDIDAFDKENLDVVLTIPEGAEEKEYMLTFWVYDEDEDLYENDYDDQESKFDAFLDLEEGSCTPSVLVSVSLESEAVAGQELTLKTTITNSGSNVGVYGLDVSGYEDWATLGDIIPSEVVLESGESKDILIKFNVNEEASGDKLLNLELLSNDKVVIEQPVSLTIDEASGFGFPGITGNIVSEGNWYLWGIGALNVLLVVVIIIVAFKVAKKPEQTASEESEFDE